MVALTLFAASVPPLPKARVDTSSTSRGYHRRLGCGRKRAAGGATWSPRRWRGPADGALQTAWALKLAQCPLQGLRLSMRAMVIATRPRTFYISL
jgi:hypothetical protein